MDESLRSLERSVKEDVSLIPQLANHYRRTSQLLVPNTCHLFDRGLLQGDIFGCLAALQLFSDVLPQTSYGQDSGNIHRAEDWFNHYKDCLTQLDRKNFFESVDFHLGGDHFLYPDLTM